MSLALIGVIGCGGFGRDIVHLARQMANNDAAGDVAEVVFVVEHGPIGDSINGHRVIALDEFEASTRQMPCGYAIAIADSSVRQRISERLQFTSARPLTLRDHYSVMLDGSQVGPGSILCAYTFIGANATVGSHFHANVYSQVEHDCVVGDYVTLGPGARCNGWIHIEDHAYIGSGAMIRQGRSGAPIVIGRGAVIGMGAVVLQSVEPGTTVVGNPARALVRNPNDG